jgi:hypothetical protein
MNTLRELEDLCGIVHPKRDPLVMPQPPERQDNAAEWWVLPVLLSVGPLLVLACWAIVEVAAWFWGAK